MKSLYMPFDEYREAPGINWSTLKHLFKSPAHMKAEMDEPEKIPSKEMVLGQLQHKAILEPEVFASEHIAAPDFGDLRTTAAKAAKAEFEKEHRGKVIVDEKDFKSVAGMSRSLWGQADLAKLLRSVTVVEGAMFWTDKGTSQRCKGRFDMLTSGGIFLDLKTTSDCRFHAFQKQAAMLHYYGQASYYLRGARAAGIKAEEFAWLVVESKPPYACQLFFLPKHIEEMFTPIIDRFLKIYLTCEHIQKWEAYPIIPEPLEAPDYYLNTLQRAV